MIRSVIFDFDGTIADTLKSAVETINFLAGKYGYEKIGFKAYLRNDNLLLLGVRSEDGKQYLVQGGLLPPRVDVVTYSQNISFKEIVNRLKRIGAAGKK